MAKKKNKAHDDWEPILTMDLRRHFGAICIQGTRVTYDAVAGSLWAEDDTAQTIADDYALDDVRDVYLSCIYWVNQGGLKRLRTERRAQWEAWALDAHLKFGGHRKGKVGDPDDFVVDADEVHQVD